MDNELNQELYNAVSEYVEALVISMPASYDSLIWALERKSAELKAKLGRTNRREHKL